MLTIPNIEHGEKWDKFSSGLKGGVLLEVMNSTVTDFEEAVKRALRVDCALRT